MIPKIGLPYIVKSSNIKFINPKENITQYKLRYIPDWFLQKELVGSYEDFMLKFKQEYNYPWRSLKQIVRKIVKNNSPIGVGRHSQVYEIPGINDYVLKIKKKVNLGFFDFVKRLKKTKNEYYGFNFGQAIADNNNGISIHMRVQGKEYGLKNWASRQYLKIQTLPQEVEHYIDNDLAKLSEFPQEAFNTLAKKISLITSSTKSKPDLYNPNNFIIDYENKKINIVDVAEDNDGFWSCHMSKGLADTEFLFLAGKTYLEKADKYVKTIREKCAIAEEAYRFSFVDFNLMNRYKK